ncbi:MAG: hypothetical protein ACR2QC_00595 [Gammaproteobacteria bacterium]
MRFRLGALCAFAASLGAPEWRILIKRLKISPYVKSAAIPAKAGISLRDSANGGFALRRMRFRLSPE